MHAIALRQSNTEENLLIFSLKGLLKSTQQAVPDDLSDHADKIILFATFDFLLSHFEVHAYSVIQMVNVPSLVLLQYLINIPYTRIKVLRRSSSVGTRIIQTLCSKDFTCRFVMI